MTFIDWAIVGAFVATVLIIGLLMAKKASSGPVDFFVAGRSLPWFIAGTSIVATTFSSDTPLWVSGLAREEGISGMWFIWSGMLSTFATIFFFARFWRRSKVLTEVEFVAIRYDNTLPLRFLRVFKVLFDGVFINCVVMASVTLAMSKVLSVIVGLPQEPLFVLPLFGEILPETLLLIGLSVIAVSYTMLSGLYGVVYTDLIQFGLAMIGAIALAVMVYLDSAPHGGLASALLESPAFPEHGLNFFPSFGWNLQTLNFVLLMTVIWLFQAPGSGYFLQRILATRSEKDAMLSIYWYTFCNFILRSWPWVIVGIASIIYFPNLLDAERSYPEMINALLPVGLKGIMVASLLGAFMSTLDTHLNWGASYVVNDVYRPYIFRHGTKKHYVQAGRISMVFLVVVATLVATQLTGILEAYKYLTVFGGMAFVAIVRWYWWRVTVWTEIAALVTVVIIGNLLFVFVPDTEGQDLFAVRATLSFIITAIVCVIVTFATSGSGPSKTAIAFYKRIRVQGPGWATVRELTNVTQVSSHFKASIFAFIASALCFYALLLAIGYALFQQWTAFAACLLLMLASGAYLWRYLPPLMSEMVDKE